MEGAYNKVLSAKSNVPDKSYLYLMDKLISTVRYVLQSCSPQGQAAQMTDEHSLRQLAIPMERMHH